MNWKRTIVKRFHGSSINYKIDTSIYSMIGMGVGSFALIIALSVMNGFEFLVHEKLKGFEGDLTITGDISENDLSTLDDVDFVMPFYERKGVAKSGSINKIITMKAVDEEIINKFFNIPINGKMPKTGQVMIGQSLANQIGKNLGDELLLYSPIDQVHGFGIPPIKKLIISGIFSTKVLNYDDQFAFFSHNDGKSLFKRKIGYDGFDLRIKSERKIEIVNHQLKNKFGEKIQLHSWRDKNRSLVDAMKMERIGAILILALIFLVSAFNLASSLILISIQKMKEIGIIKVLGSSKYDIMLIMIQLGMKKALKGVAIGFLLAIIIIIIQNNFYLIPLPSNIYFINFLPMRLTLLDTCLVLILVFTFITAASFFTARKISNLNIKESLQWIK